MQQTHSIIQTNVNKIFEQALKDPSLFSTLDIDALLDSIESDKNDYLENKTMTTVANEIYEKMNELSTTTEQNLDFCKKLIGYRYVDEINELHKGKHVRWIRTTNAPPGAICSVSVGSRLTSGTSVEKVVLTNGGIVTDVKFLDNGTHVLCMNSGRRFIQYKFDDCLTFQKLSVEEQLILMAYDYTASISSS